MNNVLTSNKKLDSIKFELITKINTRYNNKSE